MLQALQTNYATDAELLHMLKACPKFGNDDERGGFACGTGRARNLHGSTQPPHLAQQYPLRAGLYSFRHLLQARGQTVGATPDGRRQADAIADSVGPMQGRDTHGPTAMLRSRCANCQLDYGSGYAHLEHPPGKGAVQDAGRQAKGARTLAHLLCDGWHADPGRPSSTRPSCVTPSPIPRTNADLIVRIGGYSEYFNN